jgi:hypothetical protein
MAPSRALTPGFGGNAGQGFEIARNTFLGTNREIFDLRGEPTYLAEPHHNVTLRKNVDDAVSCSYCGGGINKLRVYDNNEFGALNPTNSLAVGDSTATDVWTFSPRSAAIGWSPGPAHRSWKR